MPREQYAGRTISELATRYFEWNKNQGNESSTVIDIVFRTSAAANISRVCEQRKHILIFH